MASLNVKPLETCKSPTALPKHKPDHILTKFSFAGEREVSDARARAHDVEKELAATEAARRDRGATMWRPEKTLRNEDPEKP